MHSKPNQPTRPPVKPGRPSSAAPSGRCAALDLGERVGHLAGSTTWPSSRTQRVAVEGVHAPRRQADDRVTTKALAAFDGFKQVGIGAVGELQIDRQRRVQVGQHFADDGNMVWPSAACC
jgi:hypothetical protein